MTLIITYTIQIEYFFVLLEPIYSFKLNVDKNTTINKTFGKYTDHKVNLNSYTSPVLIGGDTRITPSPRTNIIGMVRLVDL